MSVFESKAGADCSLLMSPEYVNVGCAMVEEVVELLPPALAGRNNDHGTATCLVPPANELDDELLVPEVREEVPDDVEEGVLASVKPVELLSEITAKSSLPELGLMMTSLIVPTESPEEDFTSALVNWLARTSW